MGAGPDHRFAARHAIDNDIEKAADADAQECDEREHKACHLRSTCSRKMLLAVIGDLPLGLGRVEVPGGLDPLESRVVNVVLGETCWRC